MGAGDHLKNPFETILLLRTEIARLRADYNTLKQDYAHGVKQLTVVEHERDSLREENERLTKIMKLQAAALDVWKRAHPHEFSPGACALALKALESRLAQTREILAQHDLSLYGACAAGCKCVTQALRALEEPHVP